MLLVNLTILSLILVFEYVADFKLQSRHMAINKSTDIKVLLKHIGIIFVILWGASFGIMSYLNPDNMQNIAVGATAFAGLNVIIHGIIDWNIWTFYKRGVIDRLGFTGMDLEHEPIAKQIKEFKYWEDKSFYDTIGLDRLFHIITLNISYALVWS